MPDETIACAALAHVHPIRVYYEDTDAGGIVYHAAYLKYAERARTEMIRCVGLENPLMIAREGIAFAVRHCSAEFLRPAKLDDSLEVHSWMRAVAGASIRIRQCVRRLGQDLVQLDVKVACMNLADGKAVRIPRPVRAKLEELITKEHRV